VELTRPFNRFYLDLQLGQFYLPSNSGCTDHLIGYIDHEIRFHRAGSRKRESMNYRDRITIEPDKRSGKPCIRGLRITVQDVLEYLASGMSEAEILDDFPDLEPDDIRACLAFAADRERRLMAGL
jgi:uncharacterized protein (DUF433 family)